MGEEKDNWGEKRVSKRLVVTLPMMVRGTDRHGLKFEDTTESYNLSRNGTSFLTERELVEGEEVDLIIPGRGPGGVRDFETRGKVRRIIERGNRHWEIGIEFTGPRFRTFISESD